MNVFFVWAVGQPQPSGEFQYKEQAIALAVKEATRLGLTHWVCEVIYAAVPNVGIKEGH